MSIVKKTLEVVKECIIENNFKELETDKIEIKDLSTNSDWNELYKSVCAFLNTNGGNIIIGINENKKNKKYKLTGFNYNNENKLKEIIKQFFDQKELN
jgi:ATP-dependent DNA helicase RecG